MDGRDTSEFVDYLRRHAGDNLRGAIRYGPDDHQYLTLRDDLRQQYDDAEFVALMDAYRRAEPDDEFADRLHAGDHRVTLRLYEGAAILHFPRDETSGTVVSLDPIAASDFVHFVEGCLRYLDRSR